MGGTVDVGLSRRRGQLNTARHDGEYAEGTERGEDHLVGKEDTMEPGNKLRGER